MKRVAIIGIGGKSTLAADLGKKVNLPVYHLDKYYWLDSWQERNREEVKKMVDDISSGNSWIIEGNFGMSDHWIDRRLDKADTIIFLNLPFYRVVLPRMLRRRWYYRGKTRPDIAPNNPEKLNMDFIKYLKNFQREACLNKLALLPKNKKVYIFTKPKQVRDFLIKIT